MSHSRLTLAIAMAGALLLLATAAFAGPTTAAPTPTQIAKAPTGTAGVEPAPVPKTVTPASAPQRREAVAPRSFKLAQLDYPVPPTASASDLLQAADEFAAAGDYAGFRQALQQVVAAHPGAKEAGLALGLLADECASVGDTANAAAFSSQLASYSDPEVQAYAVMCRTAFTAERTAQWDVYEKTITDYIARWKGTISAGRASMYLADRYRFGHRDYPNAMATLRQISQDYAGTVTGEEALVALAETLDWSVPAQPDQALDSFQQALNTVHYPGLQVRCLVGIADLMMKSGSPRPGR